MDFKPAAKKPHAVCIPLPGQSHMKAMLKMAKLLHSKGFHVTFVNTEFNHARILESASGGAAGSLGNLPGLRFETIPDGVRSDSERSQRALWDSIKYNFRRSFRELLDKINGGGSSADVPPVSCIVADGLMTFAVAVAQELGIPIALLFTVSASCLMGGMQYKALRDKGIVPLKDESYPTNGYLDTPVDWIPGMKNIRLKDLPTYLPTTDSDLLFKIILEAGENTGKASAVVLHTFDELERDSLAALSTMLPRIYAIGPLHLLIRRVMENPTELAGINLWKEETECLQWLDSKPPGSVVYVNFGSEVVLTQEQLIEFGMGVADSNHNFLWVIRPNLVAGNSATLPPEFTARTKGRGMISSWCPQEQVLNHASVGGFLTHCGWNSMLESVSAGLPMLCRPFQGDQPMNCKYFCDELGVGVEIGGDATRGEVEKLVKELMDGERGKMLKKKVAEWKNLAEDASCPGGSSSLNLDKLVNVLLNG